MQNLFMWMVALGAIGICFSVLKALEVGKESYPVAGRIAMLVFGLLGVMAAIEALSIPEAVHPFTAALIFFVGMLNLLKSFAPLASTVIFPKCMWHANDIWENHRHPHARAPRKRDIAA